MLSLRSTFFLKSVCVGGELKFSMVANSMSQQHNAPPKQVTQSLVTSMTVFPYKGHQIPRLGLGYGVHSGQHVFTRRLRNEFPSVKKKKKPKSLETCQLGLKEIKEVIEHLYLSNWQMCPPFSF